jgi:hypothetical protein
MARWHKSQQHQFMCKHKLLMSSLTHPNLFLRLSTKMMRIEAGCVIEGSMVFCQKNILEHSMRFHRDYIKRCLPTHRVTNGLFSTVLALLVAILLFCSGSMPALIVLVAGTRKSRQTKVPCRPTTGARSSTQIFCGGH